NTGITYLAYLLLLPVMPYGTAYTLTYIAGIGLGYYLNARFVFQQPLKWSKALQFPLVYVAQFLASAGLLYLLVDLVHISEVIGPAVVIACTVPLTFVLSRVIIKGRAHGRPA